MAEPERAPSLVFPAKTAEGPTGGTVWEKGGEPT